jgi:Cys-tRNA synthase (O-phospho-L-seryl-tRNA:Cys-tRNA synthase)
MLRTLILLQISNYKELILILSHRRFNLEFNGGTVKERFIGNHCLNTDCGPLTPHNASRIKRWHTEQEQTRRYQKELELYVNRKKRNT